ncbi:hypothetical protein ACOMHN_013739 [Nucella lapillus]
MFPNCKTAQEFKCARTKATAITKCLAKLDVEDSANQMKSGPFVIGTDGSQEGGEKHYPIVVRFCDSNGYIQSHADHTQARCVATSEPEVHWELPMSGRRGATYQKRPCTSAGSLRWCSVVPFYRTTY